MIGSDTMEIYKVSRNSEPQKHIIHVGPRSRDLALEPYEPDDPLPRLDDLTDLLAWGGVSSAYTISMTIDA